MKPAKRKPKLPAYLSFPLTYQAVSQGLQMVTFADSIELLFSLPLSATEFRKTVTARESYPVVIAEYVRWDRALSHGDDNWIQEYHDGKWSLRVYPCARDQRAEIKNALKSRGLPFVKEWFDRKRPDSWYFGRKTCEIWLDPETQKITTKCKESPR